MINLKQTIICLSLISFFSFISCNNEKINEYQNNKQLNKTLAELSNNVTNPRLSRTLFASLGTPSFAKRRRQPMKLRARADHFPLRTQVRRHYSLPNGQTQPQNIRFGYESLKSSKFIPSSKGTNPSFSNNGKGSSYRPQLMGGHPNSIQHVPAMSQKYMHNFKASPAFNGQVVIHPVSQMQKQQSIHTQQDNSYPKYVKPSPQQQQSVKAAITSQSQPQNQQPALTIYPDFKQYPIPDYDKMQQHNEQHEKYLQQQKFLTPKNPIAHYHLQKTQESQASQPQQNYAVQQSLQYLQQSQQQQQPSIPLHEGAQNKIINNIAFTAAGTNPQKMYSVYEENDMSEMPTNNFQINRYQELEKEAQEYIRFMNSNEYFLPKKEPNYKRIDDESDMRQHNALKAQAQQAQQPQAPTPYQQLLSQQAAYQQQQQQVYKPSSSSQQLTQYSNSLHSDATDTSAYNEENPVARVYTKHNHPSTASSASSTVVRTSYQTGYNQNKFFPNSQEKKSGKYTIPSTSTPSVAAIPTPSPVAYPQLRHNTPGNRTPEPLRFEFTERDAMVGGFAYTNAPQGQYKYKELTVNSATPIVPLDKSSTVNSLKIHNYLNGRHTIKTKVEEGEDDPEDGDDIQEAGIHFFGRQPAINNDANMKQLPSTTETPTSEQRDSEDYCERICAIVEDENEEIVCGSDGYMYTSEAQMECYASCLHIDVTIQGKGSCSAR